MLKHLLHGSIRKKLAILFLASALPAFAVIFLYGLQSRSESIARSENELLRFAAHVADIQETTTLSIRILLENLAMLPDIRDGHAAACKQVLDRALKTNPNISAITLADPDGRVIATTRPQAVANLSGSKHFRDAVATGKFASGEFFIGRLAPIPLFPFACPVLDDAGHVRGVLLASIPLESFSTLFNTMELPPDSFIGGCDHAGIRIFRYPSASPGPVGEPIRRPMFQAAAAGGVEGIKTDSGTDGIERIVAFRNVRLDPDGPAYMTIFIGAPKTIVHANAQREMVRNLGIFLLAMAMTLISGWFFGGKRLGRKLEELADASGRFGQGDLAARVEPDPDVTEIATLTSAFNDMAASLSREIEGMKRTEEALRLSQERLALALDATSDAIWDWDLENNQVYFSPRYATMLGYTPDDFPPALVTWEGLLHPDDRENAKRIVADHIERGEPFTLEFRLKTNDGRWRWVMGRGNVVSRNASGKPTRLIGTHVDIHDRKQMELELLNAKEAAVAANQAKSEFLANMSHEIRTPLNGIMGMLQLLEAEVRDSEQQKFCALALQSTNRLTRLLSDILDLSRIEAGKMEIRQEPFDFRGMLQQTIDLFMPISVQSQVALQLHVDPAVPSNVKGDPLRLQQVLTNLLGNAFKFTRHGRVAVEVYPLPSRNENDTRIFFTVSDTGCGISEESLRNLFQPFTQAAQGYARNHQGAGLGLTICKNLVTLMGGSIAVESEVGTGTNFHFCVTLGSLPKALAARAQTDTPQQAQATGRVLLAEDDEVTHFSVRRMLENKGYSVTSARNGQEALNRLRHEDFDTVLMDVQMPVMDGLEATRLIRASHDLGPKRNIPVVALTAYAMPGDRERFLQAGMNAYLAKPVSIAELTSTLDKFMRGGA
ncbi:ATP-binding protein [Desulfomicrobium salsuginis]